LADHRAARATGRLSLFVLIGYAVTVRDGMTIADLAVALKGLPRNARIMIETGEGQSEPLRRMKAFNTSASGAPSGGVAASDSSEAISGCGYVVGLRTEPDDDYEARIARRGYRHHGEQPAALPDERNTQSNDSD
jgi:hypothetical protein